MSGKRFQLQGLVLFLLVLTVLSGCMPGGETDYGLPDSDPGPGPTVSFDPLAHPNALVPLPNDISTAMDQGSPTGRRLNIRSTAPTKFERDIRNEINRLSGFGTFAPIMVPFDGPLDLDTVSPDSIKVINIDSASGRYGEDVPLDLPLDRSKSFYPVEIAPWPFPPYSPFAFARQMLFNPEYQGEVGSQDFLDFYERETNTLFLRVLRPMDQETEYMVVLTKDLLGENGYPVRSPFSKPVHISQLNGYTRVRECLRAKGIPEEKIAFAWSFTTQTTTRDLEVISDGIHGEGVMAYLPDRYPAVFTQVADMETDLDRLFCKPWGDNPCRDNRWILQAELLDPFMGILDTEGLIRAAGILFIDADLGKNAKMSVSLDAIDYFVFGRLQAPNFQVPGSEVFRMDYQTGEAQINTLEVPWMIAIPKPSTEHQPPFPVVVHAHGIPALRWQLITEANTWAQHGYATVAMTVPMHEPIASVQDVMILMDSIVHAVAKSQCGGLPENEQPACIEAGEEGIHALLDAIGKPVIELMNQIVFGKKGPEDGSFQDALEVFLRSGFLGQLLVEGRSQDIDGDGNTDHGAIFTADLFKSRDRIRQHIVEHMQLIQLLKNLDQGFLEENGLPGLENPTGVTDYEVVEPYFLAGDFNADGILDLGGKAAYAPYGPGEKPSEEIGPQRYVRSGLSFGGITNSILMAVEPDVKTAALSVPGGGLTDIMTRMDLHAVIDRIYHEVLGPVLVGEPAVDDRDKAGGGRSMKISFIRRGKKNLITGDMLAESLWSATQPVDIRELWVPEGGSLNVVNQENGEYIELGSEELWEKEFVCMGESVLQEGVDLTGRKGCFSWGIASDKDDGILITSLDKDKNPVDQVELAAPEKGMGKNRNSPDFRYFINLGQIALEAADPINYARHWFLEPLGGSGKLERPAKNLMVTSVPGDMFVPINAQVALARAGGLLGSESNQCDGWPRQLSECGNSWEEMSRDCDCINLLWKNKDVMVGNHKDCDCFDPEEERVFPEATSCVDEPRYDVDGFTQGTSMECNPHTTPLVDNRGQGAGYSYIRFPYSNDCCSHGYVEPVNRGMHWLMAAFYNPEIPVDWATYYRNQMAEYFDTKGYSEGISPEPDCPCPIESETCRFLP